MNRFNCLISARFDEAQLKRLKPILREVRSAGWGTTRIKLSEDELTDALKGVHIVISEYEPITRRVISSSPSLQLICCCRNGPEASVDLAAATEHLLPVLYSPGRNAVSVAEYTFGLMISLARNIHVVHHLLKYSAELTVVEYEDKTPEKREITSEWSLDSRAPFNRFAGPELSGKVLGLVGCGAIGMEIAKRAEAFGMEIVVYDPYVPDSTLAQLSAKRKSLPELARASDFLVLAAKVTEETRGMFSAELLRMMKPTAFFINTARAALVDYDALYDALKSRLISGAAIDVYPTEPITEDNPFLKLDNVLLSPHLAGASTDIARYHSRTAVDDIYTILDGKKPDRLANPEVWEKCRFSCTR